MSIGKRPHKTDIQFDGDKYLKTELVNSKVEVSTSENSIDFKKQVNIQDSESEAPNSDWLHTIKDFAGNIIMGIDRYGRSFWYGTVGYASGIMQFFSNNKKYAEFSTSQGNGFFKLFNNSEEEKVKLSSYEDNILGQKLQIPEGTENNHAVRKSQLDLKADKSITLQIGETTYDLSENRVFPLPIGSGGYEANVYLTNIDSANSGYKKIAYIPEATETIKSIVATNNTVLGEKYLYDSQIGITNIPSGEWKFKLYGRISSTSGGTSTVTIRVFRYLENGTEVDLVFGSKVISNTTNDTIQFTSTQAGNVDSNLTDRLGIQISLTTTRSTATTFYYSLGDGNAAYINSPLPLRHELLRDIEWLSSGHKGTANKLAGFDSFGNAAEIGLPVQKNTGETYYISDTEPSDTWESGKKSFKTWAGFLAQLDTNIIRYYTRTGTTTNASATITTADTSNLKVGQRVTGIGIPYDSFVQSIVSNTSFTINNTCTANGTVTVTNWVGIWVEMFGAVEITASITNLDGVYFNNTKTNITYGNFSLYNQTVTRVTPFVLIGGYYIGTGANSRLYYKYMSSGDHKQYNTDLIKDVTCYSKCTSELIYTNQGGGYSYGILKLINSTLITNGKVLSIEYDIIEIVGGYRYGLLGGIYIISGVGTLIESSGYTQAPSNYAINIAGQGSISRVIKIDDIIYGSVVAQNGGCDLVSFNGLIYGNVNSGSNNSYPTYFSYIKGNVTTTGQLDINTLEGDLSQNGTGITTVKRIKCAYLSLNGGGEITVHDKWRVNNWLFRTIVTNGILNIYGNFFANDYLTISANGIVNLYGQLELGNGVNGLAGKLNLNPGSKLTTSFKNANITGELNVNNAEIQLKRDGYSETASTTPTFPITTGTVILVGGGTKVYCPHADSKSGLFQKVGTGGKIITKGFPSLMVSNGLSPIQILSNAGTSQDIHISQANSNCNGTTYGLKLIFGDTTYGTTYAPNDVLNGVVFENTLLT